MISILCHDCVCHHFSLMHHGHYYSPQENKDNSCFLRPIKTSTIKVCLMLNDTKICETFVKKHGKYELKVFQ